MNYYERLDAKTLAAERTQLETTYEALCQSDLSLNISRGNPSEEQLNLSRSLFDEINSKKDLISHGENAANYGIPQGLWAARKLFGELLEVDPKHVLVSGSSSLNLMFDVLSHGFMRGFSGAPPWKDTSTELLWLCPSPGYDRHFAVSKYFGFTNVAIPMQENGPNMDMVEELVQDPRVKGIWCVPRFSNPTGVIYSDEVVQRFAKLKPAASDFRIMWDNAYCVHAFNQDAPRLANIFANLGKDNLVFEFASTSKITFAGAGIACVTASESDLANFMNSVQIERVCSNKINQLAHARFLPNKTAVIEHMSRIACILRPKFELVERKLTNSLETLNLATWTKPQGGYFVSFNGPTKSAKEIVSLCNRAGLMLTDAGATWPNEKDPLDSNIRIAPTFPKLDELEHALDVFVLCVKLQAARAASR